MYFITNKLIVDSNFTDTARKSNIYLRLIEYKSSQLYLNSFRNVLCQPTFDSFGCIASQLVLLPFSAWLTFKAFQELLCRRQSWIQSAFNKISNKMKSMLLFINTSFFLTQPSEIHALFSQQNKQLYALFDNVP